MSLNVHKDIDGGSEYLPFALAKLKSLRATGLRYASQSYQVGDATIVVRIEGDHSFVKLRAGAGGYMCLPHSDAHPDGVTSKDGATVEPTAVVTIGSGKEAKPKVKEHKYKKTGSNDWRGKVGGKTKVITYSAFPQRYRFFGAGAYELPGIYDGGKKIETECLIPGVGQEVCGVKGACIVEFEGKAYYLMATSANQYPETRLFVFYRQVGSPDWKFSVSIDAPQHYAFTDPVYFSPDGKKFNTLARWTNPVPGTIGKSKKISGTAILQVIGTTTRVGITHTTSGELMVVTKDEQYPFTPLGGYTKQGTVKGYTVPVAVDYDADGNEIYVVLDVEATAIAEDETPLVPNSAAGAGTYVGSHTAEDATKAYLKFGAKVMASLVWKDLKSSSSTTTVYEWLPIYLDPILNGDQGFLSQVSQESTQTSESTYSFPQVLAADARTGALAVVTVESKPATSDPSSYVFTRKLKTELAFGLQKKNTETALPNGLPLYQPPPFVSNPHTVLSGWFAKSNYASLDGKTFMFSVSPDEVLDAASQYPIFVNGDPNVSPTNAPLNWIAKDGGTPNALFSIGGEPDFTLTPITIF